MASLKPCLLERITQTKVWGGTGLTELFGIRGEGPGARGGDWRSSSGGMSGKRSPIPTRSTAFWALTCLLERGLKTTDSTIPECGGRTEPEHVV